MWIPLFWTSGDVCQDFTSKVDSYSSTMASQHFVTSNVPENCDLNLQTEFKLDTYMADRELMKEHIDRMQFEGSETNISGALRQARYDIFDSNHGDRPNIQNVALVVADGECLFLSSFHQKTARCRFI